MRFSPFLCSLTLFVFAFLFSFVFASWASELTGSWMSKEGLETHPPLLAQHLCRFVWTPGYKAVTKQLQPRVTLFCCFRMKVFPTAAPGAVCWHRRHTDTHCRGLGPTLSGCSVPSTALLHSFIFSFILLKSEGYLMPCSCWTTTERKWETPLTSLYNSNAENKCVWRYTGTKCI